MHEIYQFDRVYLVAHSMGGLLARAASLIHLEKGRIDHHLLFGYLDKSGDDGSVHLASVLLEEAQNDAVDIHGFEARHVDILFKDAMFESVQNGLNDSEDRIASAERKSSEEASMAGDS